MDKDRVTDVGTVGTNVPKNIEEMEEDLLETIYRRWRNTEPTRLVDLMSDYGGSEADLQRLVRRMLTHGYIETDKGSIKLTDVGKLRGKECLDRHQKLTQFFQMVSGMDEQEAEKDACRVEHTISRSAMEGINNFLIFGDVYDRSFTNVDLATMFSPGRYQMAMEIYEIERRQPRRIASEWHSFEPYVLLEATDVKSRFCLIKNEDAKALSLWYKDGESWSRAEEDEDCIYLPSHLFDYTVSAGVPVTEGNLMVALTTRGERPFMPDFRELNIHVM